MLSTRLFAVLAVLATVAALPATDRPITQPLPIAFNDNFESQWFPFPVFGNLFEPIWKLIPNFASLGPKIVSDDDQFQVVVNVKDYKKEDLKVKVKGNFIFIQGSHEAKQDDHDIFASQFFHTYSLPTNASGADVTAELTNDGNLIVTAPVTNNTDKPKESEDREVPIVESGKPLTEEAKPIDKEETPAATTQVLETEDDRKEPTTPSDKEEVVEKDNAIPYGDFVKGQL